MPRRYPGGPCMVHNCSDSVWAKSYCQKHYMRWLRHGHVEETRPKGWGSKKKHPLYHSWSWVKRRGRLCPEWSDFWKFVEDIGDRPSKNHLLRPVRDDEPLSRANFFWAPQQTFVEWTPDRKKRAREYQRQYRRIAPKNIKSAMLRKLYGIGYAEYSAIRDAQDGVCAVCGNKETHTIRGRVLDLAVDHCHNSKRVRGLLCHRCNTGIGSFRDDPDLLRAAIVYLEKHDSEIS